MDKIIVGGIGMNGMNSIWDIYDGLMGYGRKEKEKEKERAKATSTPKSSAWLPRTDVVTRADGVTVMMDVPGYSSKEIEVGIEDEMLVIEGKRVNSLEAMEGANGAKGEDDKGLKESTLSSGSSGSSGSEICTLRERVTGDGFSRSFTMAEGVFDIEKIKAVVKDGVLRVDVPMKPIAPPKASKGIRIKVG